MSSNKKKTNENEVIKFVPKSIKRSDFERINILFAKWQNWLLYIAFSYIVVFFAWNDILERILYFSKKTDLSIKSNPSFGKFALNSWRILLIILIVILRGLVFCVDGIVSSWLKTPFGQLTYWINKSGVESSKSDEIITLLTEINEHFKETFKKFGVFTISKDIFSVYRGTMNNTNSKDTSKQLKNRGISMRIEDDDFVQAIVSSSLLIPIILAYWRMTIAKKLINEIEISPEEQENDL